METWGAFDCLDGMGPISLGSNGGLKQVDSI